MNTSFTSVGNLARTAIALPQDIIAAANRLGVEPAMVIDGKPLFSADDARRIVQELRGQHVAADGLLSRANHLS